MPPHKRQYFIEIKYIYCCQNAELSCFLKFPHSFYFQWLSHFLKSHNNINTDSDIFHIQPLSQELILKPSTVQAPECGSPLSRKVQVYRYLFGSLLGYVRFILFMSSAAHEINLKDLCVLYFKWPSPPEWVHQYAANMVHIYFANIIRLSDELSINTQCSSSIACSVLFCW